VANLNQVTQISRRFAAQLELSNFEDVDVTSVYDLFGVSGVWKWKVSVDPIVFTCHGAAYQCYPVVNGSEDDAFWEMIIGREVIGKDFFGTSWCESSDHGQTATPGPGYEPDTSFMGHNICRVENGEKVILQELVRVFARISLPTYE
jgi:hypothetical protein